MTPISARTRVMPSRGGGAGPRRSGGPGGALLARGSGTALGGLSPAALPAAPLGPGPLAPGPGLGPVGRGPAVGAVETAPLEGGPDGGHHPAQRSAAG